MIAIIEIRMDNAAFEDDPAMEVMRILNGLVNRIADHGLPTDDINLRDVNGNTLGTCKITGR